MIRYLLSICSLIYGVAIAARALLYRFGIFKSSKAPIKVISVGNLTLGGTGKTPFVIMLSRILKDEFGKEAAVLIRGYGWDEQAMLKKSLPDIPILVGEDRVKSAHRAIRLYGIDTAVLDDGFQYWELQRDLDIVLIDSRNPFGNGHLFPAGIMREAKDAVRRADIVVFTKVNPAKTKTVGGAGKKRYDIDGLKEELSGIRADIIYLETLHRPKSFYDDKAKRIHDLSIIKGKRVILVSSIGDPSYFEETARALGAEVIEHMIFGDHHNYNEGDIKRIVKRCDERSFDAVITTEKDAAKLARMRYSFGSYMTLVLIIEMEIVSGKEFLIDRLHSLYNS